jgi:hypothetical protein
LRPLIFLELVSFWFCGSAGALNQVMRHNDFNAKMYTSEKRSCRYFAFF